MQIGTILLTPNNEYVDFEGNLPIRPPQDKQLLSGLCKDRWVSEAGYTLLPPSIKKDVLVNKFWTDIAITIQELSKADLLIVSRSPQNLTYGGKVFRLDKFTKIYTSEELELWVKIM